MLAVPLARRAVLQLLAGGLSLGALPGEPASAASVTGVGGEARRCVTVSDPSKTIVTCRGFGLSRDTLKSGAIESRVGGCAADEACVATSAVRNPTKYGPPWRPVSKLEESDQARAWRAVVAAVTDEPGLTIVEQDDSVPYLRAEAQSTIPPDGTDDVEFVLRDDGGVRCSTARRDHPRLGEITRG